MSDSDGHHAESSLLARQEELTREADLLIRQLDLPTLLARAGEPHQIGSSVYGLMVWRDLDFTILCRPSSREAIAQIIASLIALPAVRRLTYDDEVDRRNLSGDPGDDRHYVVFYVDSDLGHEWKVDLSFWTKDRLREELEHPSQLAARLTPESRLAILQLKDIWHRRPEYPYEIGGYDVYQAVLDHGVRTPAEFARYLEERRLPHD